MAGIDCFEHEDEDVCPTVPPSGLGPNDLGFESRCLREGDVPESVVAESFFDDPSGNGGMSPSAVAGSFLYDLSGDDFGLRRKPHGMEDMWRSELPIWGGAYPRVRRAFMDRFIALVNDLPDDLNHNE